MDPRNAPGSAARSRSHRSYTLLTAGSFAWCSELDYLSDGVTASVYRCRETQTGDFYAIKVFKDRPTIREIEVLQMLKHENIVRLIAKVQFPDERQTLKTGLVLEYCPGGSLHEHLKSPENWHGLCDTEFLTLLFNMSDGLAYLREQKKVLHRDIKPGNILISWDSRGQAVFKLADFGSSRELEDNGEFQSLVGTYEFLHPNIYQEVYRRQQQLPGASSGHKPECDLWSLGVTLYQAATGQLAFSPYGGVRNNHQTMIDMMLRKPDTSISATQETRNGPIVYSDQLPPDCHLSASLRSLLAPVLQGMLACQFDKQWSFAKFLSSVREIKLKKSTYFFIANSMIRPDIVFSQKATYESLVQGLAEQTGYSKEEMLIYYRSQAVTAFPTGTTPSCPIIVLSMGRLDSQPERQVMNVDCASRQLPAVSDVNNIKEVKDFVEAAYKNGLACQDLARAVHLRHTLVLEAKEAIIKEFSQRRHRAEHQAASKVTLVSSSQQKVGGLMELAKLLRAQLRDEAFDEAVMHWTRQLEEAEDKLKEVGSELQDTDSSAAERLRSGFNEQFGNLAEAIPNIRDCISAPLMRTELVHKRYEEIVKLYRRGRNAVACDLVRASFGSDRQLLSNCISEIQSIIGSCCVETQGNISARLSAWLSTSLSDELCKLARLEGKLNDDIESELDLLHHKLCREILALLRQYFALRNESKQADLLTFNKALKSLIASTAEVESELRRNDQLMKELDELGLRNSGLSSLDSQASAELQ